jgi:hypothetical protein
MQLVSSPDAVPVVDPIHAGVAQCGNHSVGRPSSVNGGGVEFVKKCPNFWAAVINAPPVHLGIDDSSAAFGLQAGWAAHALMRSAGERYAVWAFLESRRKTVQVAGLMRDVVGARR